MTKAQFAHRSLKKWVNLLHLDSFVIKMRLRKNLDPYEQSQEWSSGTDGSSRCAIITISLNQPTDDIEWSIAHELFHVVLDDTSVRHWALAACVHGDDTKSMDACLKDYNTAENVVIEHALRVIYTLLGQQYPPHKQKHGEIVVMNGK